MSNLDVRNALIQGVIDANITNYPVKWPNAPFDTPSGTWIRATILNYDDDPVTIGKDGYNDIGGVMQLAVFVPSKSGDLVAMGVVEELKSTFKTGSKLTNNGQVVRIDSAPVRLSETEADWFTIIITVNFTAYLTRS